MRVAIVGQGPKGMFALERLLAHGAGLDPSIDVQVDLFEPHRAPGAGPVYDPEQPDYLRMNFPAGRVDMWWPKGAVVPTSHRLSFSAWQIERGERVDHEDYPPRGTVGRYLTEGHSSLMRYAPSNLDVRLHSSRVQRIRRSGSGWELFGAASYGHFDEVLIATGHEPSSSESLSAGWRHAAPLIPTVFPVQTRLSCDAVPPGATVGVRGFGLSFIDATIALTEGRGGRFEPLTHPYRLRYIAGGEEVGRILPFSRTGLPMLSKPTSRIKAPTEELERIAAAARERILGLPSGIGLDGELLGVIAETVARTLLASSRLPAEARRLPAMSRSVLGELREMARGGGGGDRIDPAEEIDRALAIGSGLQAPDVSWAIGHSWRVLYPTLVQRLSGAGLRDEDWPSFHRLARSMERLAFGPAPINAAKLLALIVAGRVDLTHVKGGVLTDVRSGTELRSSSGARRLDSVVDAVLPGPGVQSGGGELLEQLLSDGHARSGPGRRGLEVCSDGSCIGTGGLVSEGLSAVGRPTEDSVIGNDTLDRSLHPLADRWATRVIDRCRATAEGHQREHRLTGAAA